MPTDLYASSESDNDSEPDMEKKAFLERPNSQDPFNENDSEYESDFDDNDDKDNEYLCMLAQLSSDGLIHKDLAPVVREWKLACGELENLISNNADKNEIDKQTLVVSRYKAYIDKQAAILREKNSLHKHPFMQHLKSINESNNESVSPSLEDQTPPMSPGSNFSN